MYNLLEALNWAKIDIQNYWWLIPDLTATILECIECRSIKNRLEANSKKINSNQDHPCVIQETKFLSSTQSSNNKYKKIPTKACNIWFERGKRSSIILRDINFFSHNLWLTRIYFIVFFIFVFYWKMAIASAAK